MIVPWTGLIDRMISSLSRLAALAAAQAPNSFSCPLLPVTRHPSITSPTLNPFNSVTVGRAVPLSNPFHIFL